MTLAEIGFDDLFGMVRVVEDFQKYETDIDVSRFYENLLAQVDCKDLLPSAYFSVVDYQELLKVVTLFKRMEMIYSFLIKTDYLEPSYDDFVFRAVNLCRKMYKIAHSKLNC